MTKNELASLLTKIEIYYPGKFKATDETFMAWWKMIQKYDVSLCEKNLERHVENEEWPPTIANLIKGKKDQSRNYTDKLVDNMDSVKPYEEIVAEIERRTGMKVKS